MGRKNAGRGSAVGIGTRFLVLLCLQLASPLGLRGGSFVNFESGPVRPLALSPGGDLLFAVNTADNRLEVLRATASGLERAGEVFVGLEPVAVAAGPGGQVWVVNHLSDSVSVVDASDPSRPFVRASLAVGDEPRDVVLAGLSGERAFITAAHRGQNRPGDPELTTPGVGRADVWLFDARDLEAPPRIITLFADTPRALARSPDGRRVYAAAFHSGNRTAALGLDAATGAPEYNLAIQDGFTGLGMLSLPPDLPNASGVPPPEVGVILRFDGRRWLDAAGRDWTARARFDLPDRDVFEIDAEAERPEAIASASGVGTIIFNLAVHPRSGTVYASNLDSRNDIAYLPRLRGRPVENRVTVVDFSAPAERRAEAIHLNPPIDPLNPAGSEAEREEGLALPLALEFSPDGERLYVAAFGSRKVAVLDTPLADRASVIERIAVGGGPCGLALDASRGRLYVLNRFDLTISIVNTASLSVTGLFPLRYHPEPVAMRAGREHLYDARSSAHGDASCGSCHIFADSDSLAWDLGDPGGKMEENAVVRVAIQGDAPLAPFHPLKGPMATRSLRGLEGTGPLHWRGDRSGGRDDPFNTAKAFLSFRSAFTALLGRPEEFPESDMEKLRDFVLSIRLPPNPIAPLDGTLGLREKLGRELYLSSGNRDGAGGDGARCQDCHPLPGGADGRGAFVVLPQDFKNPSLRGLYQKVGMFGTAIPDIAREEPFTLRPVPTAPLGEQVRGFGFLHEGAVPRLFNFFRSMRRDFAFRDEAGGPSGDEKVQALEAFLLAFPTGLAPIVGQEVTLDQGSLTRLRGRFELLRQRSEAGEADLVAHGLLGGEVRGLFRERDGLFQTDRVRERLSEEELLAAVETGEAIFTFLAAPPGTGRRLGIDRDEDGALDLDEIDAGSDPADPLSLPPPVRFLRSNCNGDDRVDIADPIFALGFLFLGGRAVPCAEACDGDGDGRLDITDPIAALEFLFGGGRPPGAYPACEVSTGNCGEPACPAH